MGSSATLASFTNDSGVFSIQSGGGKANISSTGLAVTGAVSSTGNYNVSAGFKLTQNTNAYVTPEDNVRGAVLSGTGGAYLMVGGSVIAGATSSGFAVTGSVSVNNTAITTSNTVSSFLAPNLVNANRSALFIGRSFASNDAAYIGYTPQSTSSLSQLNLGFFGADNLVNITAAGNVGIGTSSPGAKLEAYGDFLCGTQTAGSLPSASNTGFYFANPYNVSAARWSGGSYTGSLTLVNVYNGNGVVGTVVTNGSVTTWGSISDYRRKSNVQDLTGSGTFIDALKPRTFDWSSGDKGVGFIAHEFAEVCPSAVTGEKDAVDAEGNPVYQSMQAGTAEVIANLVAELQSVRQRLAALENS
jgi:hypothetical protein